jgi:hypothetical protein
LIILEELTNATFPKAKMNKLADISHNGIARAIRPSHTTYDGDTLFVLGFDNTRGTIPPRSRFAAHLVYEHQRLSFQLLRQKHLLAFNDQPFQAGNYGAGTGCSVGTINGAKNAMKGGIARNNSSEKPIRCSPGLRAPAIIFPTSSSKTSPTALSVKQHLTISHFKREIMVLEQAAVSERSMVQKTL